MFFYKSFSSRPGKPPRRDIFIYIQYVKCSMKYSQAGRELLCLASNHKKLEYKLIEVPKGVRFRVLRLFFSIYLYHEPLKQSIRVLFNTD